MKTWQKWCCVISAGAGALAISAFVALSAKNAASDMELLAATDVKTYQSDALQQYEDAKREKVNQYAVWVHTQVVSDPAESPEADTTSEQDAFTTNNTPAIYYIQPGDTLTKISAQVLYSVDELADYNKIRDVNLIYANSVLRVPD